MKNVVKILGLFVGAALIVLAVVSGKYFDLSAAGMGWVGVAGFLTIGAALSCD